jgi:hypothetical protein
MMVHRLHGILAHAGGLDEMAIILFPIVVGGTVWVLTRTPNSPNKPKLPRVAPSDRKSKPVFGPADRKTKPPPFS